jgi:hypothetical protein
MTYDIVRPIMLSVYVGQKSDACGGDVVGRWYRQKGKPNSSVTDQLDSFLDDSISWSNRDSNRGPIDS